ncbi:unnamed protein product, partial [Meganyctiphanes norvegica]
MACCLRMLLVRTFYLGALVAYTVCSSTSGGSKRSLQITEAIDLDEKNITNGTVRFCCDEGHFYNASNLGCEPDSSIIARPPFHDYGGVPLEVPPVYHSVVGFPNCTESYALDPYDPNDAFHLLPDGQLEVPAYENIMHPDSYCLLVTGVHQIEAVLCFPDEGEYGEEPSFHKTFATLLLPIGLIISSVFLAATLLVYCLVPELRDLLGKCMMCAISSLCLGQLITAFLNLGNQIIGMGACVAGGLLMQFSFLAAFMWLNVICVNVFLALWGRHEVVHLWMYGLYAWGIAAFFTLLALIRDMADMGHINFLPKPNFGLVKCFFADNLTADYYLH